MWSTLTPCPPVHSRPGRCRSVHRQNWYHHQRVWQGRPQHETDEILCLSRRACRCRAQEPSGSAQTGRGSEEVGQVRSWYSASTSHLVNTSSLVPESSILRSV